MTRLNREPGPKIVAKMTATLRSRGIRPQQHGGNWRGLTVPQEKLWVALGRAPWIAEYSIKTADIAGQIEKLPRAYKVDLGLPSLKLAVEVDGRSHRAKARKAQDAKKEKALGLLGWSVLRFSNEQVLNDIDICLERIREQTRKSLRESTV